MVEVAAAAAILAAGFGIGGLALRRLAGAPAAGGADAAERALLALALGLGLLPLLAAAAGIVGALGVPAAVAIVVGGAVAAVRPAAELLARRTPLARPGLVGLLLAVAGIAAAALSTLPPTDHDAAVYHLGLAGDYAVAGRIRQVPHTIYAGFPQGASALYALCLLLAGDGTAAKIVSVAHGAVAAAAVAALGRRLDPRAGAWAAALFVLSPAALFLANFCGADLVAAAHAAGALLALARGEAALAGLLAGAAAGAKYQGFLFVAALVAAALRLRGGRAAAVVAACALLPPLPWLAKNLVATGDPFYPLLSALPPGVADRVAIDLARFGRPGGLADLALLPVRLLAAPDRFEIPLGGASIAAAAAALLWARRAGALGEALALAAALFGAGWALTLPVSRFALPGLAAAAPVAAAAAVGMEGRSGRLARALLIVLMLLQMRDAARYTSAYFDPQAVLLRGAPRAAYQRARLPLARLAPYAREFLPPAARVLFVGEIRRFPFPREIVAGSPYDEQPVAAYLRASADVADLLGRLEADGVTHVVVDVEAAATARDLGVLALDDRERALWNDLAARGMVGLAVDPPVGLYRLRRPAEI